jgi:hypothetical protein
MNLTVNRYTADTSFTAGALDALRALLRLLAPSLRAARRDNSNMLELAAGRSQALEQPQGVHLVCLEGCVWITHDDSADDFIVERGQHFVAASNSRMLVHAMSASRVRTWTPDGR